jgi:hypothetical protein
MPKPTPQQCHALIDYYQKAYAEANGDKPVVNRNKAKFTMEALLRDYDATETKAILDYYVKHYERDLEWFNYNYEKVVAAKREADKTARLTADRRRETAQRLEQWKKRQEEWKKS